MLGAGAVIGVCGAAQGSAQVGQPPATKLTNYLGYQVAPPTPTE